MISNDFDQRKKIKNRQQMSVLLKMRQEVIILTQLNNQTKKNVLNMTFYYRN